MLPSKTVNWSVFFFLSPANLIALTVAWSIPYQISPLTSPDNCMSIVKNVIVFLVNFIRHFDAHSLKILRQYNCDCHPKLR